ncbi:MAG: carboxylesterase/lipase family protein [Steroidobacteraceae bacterium]
MSRSGPKARPRSRATALCLLALGSAACCRAATPNAAPQIRVAQGVLEGVRAGHTVAFLGVPYAAPPIGPNRWRAPQPLRPWEGVRRAQHFAPSCLQTLSPQGFGPWSSEYGVHGALSENCLYLNVWAPAHPTHALPVMVWIPGGAFVSGSGSVPIYAGKHLAAHGIIVVTLNYRLGVFGFLTDPALAAEALRRHEPPGNWGLQDILAALQWVRTNIGAFGGNAHEVTLAGQSAGAMAVQDLLASPLAQGLFERAIAESGLPNSRLPDSPMHLATLAAAERAGERFARAKGALTSAGLRALSPAALSTSTAPMSSPLIMPSIDGRLLPASPEQRLAAGRVANIPMLIGMTADENTAFRDTPATLTGAAWRARLQRRFGTLAARFARMFPARSPRGRARALRAMRRAVGLAALYHWSRLREAHLHAPVYAYLWTHVEPGPHSHRWRAFHSSEIPYVFGTLNAAAHRHFTPLDHAISRQMLHYWVNFIATGNPNGAGLAHWPALTAGKMLIMRLGAHPAAQPILPPRLLRALRAYISAGGIPQLY